VGDVRVRVCALSGERTTDACPHAIEETMPREAAERLGTCRMHEHVRVDRRNGLRAGASCPAAFVEERVFERFDGMYAAWAHAAKRDVAPEEYSPLCPAGDAEREKGGAARLRIGWPRDGARFIVDPERSRAEQVLRVRIDAPAWVQRVALRVDGKVVARAAAPFVAEWTLAEGEHVMVAEAAGGGASDEVRVAVE
jgi:penicillin-binding protein 1C